MSLYIIEDQEQMFSFRFLARERHRQAYSGSCATILITTRFLDVAKLV